MKLRVDFALNSAKWFPPAKGSQAQMQKFISRHWPMLETYQSPVPLMAAAVISDLQQLRSSPIWLVRDGAKTVGPFFARHPSPLREAIQLLIHEQLADLVPEAWKANIYVYRLVSFSISPRPEPEGLIIAGLNGKGLINPAKLIERIRAAKSMFNGSTHRTLVAAPICHNHPMIDTETIYQTLSVVGEACNSRLEFFNWLEAERIQSMDKFILVEMNEVDSIADPFMSHFFLSRGARFVDRELTPTQIEQIFPLSLYHGVWTEPLLSYQSQQSQVERNADC